MSATLEQLQSLLGRVEQATGPDKHIDVAILPLWDPGHEALRPYDSKCQTELRDGGFSVWTEGYSSSSPFPRFTASIDVALSLVERLAGGDDTPSMVYCFHLDWHASAHSEMAYVAELFVADGDPCAMTSYHAQSHTLPLAILAALLKALIAQKVPA